MTRINALASSLATRYPVLQQKLVEYAAGAGAAPTPIVLCAFVLQETCVQNQCK